MSDINNMIYQIEEKPPIKKLLLFALQMMLSVFVASILIAQICGVDVSAALVGAGLGTLAYQVMTKFKSPMFISNSGAFVAPVIMALSLGGYTGILVGGITTFLVYVLFGIVFSKIPVENIYKIFPRALIGAVTAVIGINLMGFLGTYVLVGGEVTQWGLIVALITALAIALISHYAKGLPKILPFLLGTLIGYAISIILTITGICPLIDFSIFSNLNLFCMPDFAFLHLSGIGGSAVATIVVTYIAYTISAMMECLSDHTALGNIVGVDLFKTPSLGKIFIGEGCSNLVSSFIGGLGACSYGEGVATTGFSRVASTIVTTVAAIMLAALGFIAPIQAFITSIPSCVFCGSAMILYGFIAASGIKILQKVDLNNQKNLIIVSTVLSIGISGLALGGTVFSFSGTALALIVGVILNLILKEKETV